MEDREIGLALDLAKNPKSEWIASMSVPAENATGLVVTDVVVSGDSVKFVGVELMMAKFDLTLAPDGRMGGPSPTRKAHCQSNSNVQANRKWN